MSNAPDSRFVIGVGHRERRDDGVGPFVAEGLCQQGLQATVHEGDGTGLLDIWDARKLCIVVDALADAAAPGTVRVFSDLADSDFLHAPFLHSTHRIGVKEAVALGRSLGCLPERLLVIGITGADFGFGKRLSPPVQLAAERLIAQLATADATSARSPVSGLKAV